MKQKIIKSIIFAVAAAFIVVGIARGDYADTLHKAIIICLECIGIG